MDTPVTGDVFQSPAMAILCDLNVQGFRIELMADGALTIAPRSKLTPARMQAIAAHKHELKTLLITLTNAGVIQRRDVFARQLAQAPAPRVPVFLFRENVVYRTGTCFSCGDGLPQLKFGRCWRCAVAWRFACKVSIPADLAAALDSAKVIT